MICSTCDTVNPGGAKFCNNCGTRLPEPCAACGTTNPAGAKFCNNCGSNLPGEPRGAQAVTPTSEPAVSDTLNPLLPGEVKARLESTRTRGEGERRIVTILFCDVKGSTAAAATLDPEEWTEIINGAFEYMIQPVYDYDGTVARLTGDGILAFFGAPVAHEDDPQRAVLAGLAIAEGVRSYSESIRARWDIDFSVRVGINTGLVVVGAVGSAQRMEYTAMGDAINIAARMEQTAEPGTVQIAQDTFELVNTRFEMEDLGPLMIKGKSQPVQAYRVLRPRAFQQAGRMLREGTPLVGRDWELRALAGAMARAEQGRGGIVSVIGDAGIGKSRLIREAARMWQETQSMDRWYASASLSYETSVPYAQFQRLLRRGVNISSADGPDAARAKLASYVAMFKPAQQDEARAVLEQVLSISRAAGEHVPEGEAFKDVLFRTMLELTRSWAAAEPMVLLLDDLHWSDPASVELLTHLLQLVTQCRILFVCATRIERESPGWQITTVARERFAQHYTEIWLHPLSQSDSQHLMRQVAGQASLSSAVRQQIEHKADGNPLYVEELVLSILGTEQTASAVGPESISKDDRIEIPDTLQALLLSRVDRLDEGARYTAQQAAVIGYQFRKDVLAIISEPAVDVPIHLLTLQEHELIGQIAPDPGAEYAFRHALLQDAIYHSILRGQRRVFHQRVAEALRSLFSDRLAEFAPLLAYHFRAAGDPQAAMVYYTLAGDTAFRLYANAEAVANYSEALELAQTVVVSDDSLLHLYTRHGRALDMLGRYADADQNYLSMEAQGRATGNRSLELAGIAARATLYSIPSAIHDPLKGKQLSQAALVLAREVGDHEAEARLLWNLLLASKFAGTPAEAVAYGQESLAVARAHGLRERMAFALNDLAIFGYVDADEPERAIASLLEARPLWLELNNQPMLADNLSSAAFIYFMLGDFNEVLEHSAKSMVISQQVGSLWGQSYSLWPVSDVQVERGEWGEALINMQRCADLAKEAGFVAAAVGVGSSMASLYAEMGATERSLTEIRRVEQLAEDDIEHWLAWPLGLEVQLLQKLGRTSEAAAVIDRINRALANSKGGSYLPYVGISVGLARGYLAIGSGEMENALVEAGELLAYVRRARIDTFLPAVCTLMAHCFSLMGRDAEAEEHLLEACRVAKAIGSKRSLWHALAALARLEAGRGNTAAAQSLRSEAAAIVEFIAANITDPELRASFLAQEEVRVLLEPQGAS